MSAGRQPVTVVTGRHPFEVLVMIAALTVGIALIAVDQPPKSVAAAMPEGLQVAWQIGLILAGMIGLAGITWLGRLGTSLAIEVVGIIILGAATSMYGLALYAVSGVQAIAAGAFVSAIAVASWWRVWQIIRDLRRIARAVAAADIEAVPLLMEDIPR